MKKITKKLAFMLLSSILLVAATVNSNAFAADKMMSLTLRVEGIDENIYYDSVEVPYTDTLTLQDALTYIDTQEDSLSIIGVDTAYITDVNGETAGQFGGYDGWLYKVNGAEPIVGIDGLQLADGDNIVLYYGDPFGVGMQYPVADATNISEGIIKFTSSDTTYDANYTATVTVNPVVGATVTWNSGEESKDYVTNDDGEININKDQLTPGAHVVQISKISDAGIPLVLRFASDYTVSVGDVDTVTNTNDTKGTDSAIINDGTEAVTAEDVNNDLPKTGDRGYQRAVIFGIIAVVALAAVIFLKRKGSNEK